MLAALGAWLGPLGILVAFGLGSVLAAFGMVGVLMCSTLCDGFSQTRKRYVATASGTAGSSSSGRSTGGQATRATSGRKARRVLPFAVPMAVSTWIVLAWMMLRA
jgi:prepilin peptidase CpaA